MKQMTCSNCNDPLTSPEEWGRNPPTCKDCHDFTLLRRSGEFQLRDGSKSPQDSLKKRVKRLERACQANPPPELSSWLVNPGNLSFFRAIEAKLNDFDKKQFGPQLRDLLHTGAAGGGRSGLSCHSIGATGSVLMFGLTGRQRHTAHSAALACMELVDNASRMLKAPSVGCEKLADLYFGAGQPNLMANLLYAFEELRTTAFSSPGVIFHVGSAERARVAGQGRTQAYVDLPTDEVLIGKLTQLGCRCVYLPPAFFEIMAAPSDGPVKPGRMPTREEVSSASKRIALDRFTAGATVLHEMTHICLDTLDLPKQQPAYGRSPCKLLATSNTGDAQRNADNYAMFALDLQLHG